MIAVRRDSLIVAAAIVVTIIAVCQGLAQVPVDDSQREKTQDQTRQSHSAYSGNMRGVKSGSGGITDSTAPGQGAETSEGCTGAPSQADGNATVPRSKTQIAEAIMRIAREEGVDPNFALAIAQQESRFDQNARSDAGAIGVMQLMPGTAREVGVDPYDSNGNIRGGVRYLKKMLAQFSGRTDLAAAAYNAGPNRQSLHAGHVPNIPETQDYVRKVTANYQAFKSRNGDLGQESSTPQSVSAGGPGCAEQIKKAWDRNTQAQLERGQAANQLVQKSLEANQLHNQAALENLRIMSGSLKGMDSGNRNPGFGEGRVTPAPVACPAGTNMLGAAQCFAVPTVMSTGRVREWLAELQSQAQASGSIATFNVVQNSNGALIAIVETRPQG